MVNVESIDALLEKDASKAYEELKKLNENGEEKNEEVLWRLAKACFLISANIDSKDPRKKEIILQGRGYAMAAYQQNPNSFNVLKWAAALTGNAYDFMSGVREKIEESHIFKDLLDKALAMDACEFSLLHMRILHRESLVDRTETAVFIAALPEGTFDDALRDFEEANKARPGWIENLMYLARCHVAKKDNLRAVPYLKEILTLTAEDDVSRAHQLEARKLVAKYDK